MDRKPIVRASDVFKTYDAGAATVKALNGAPPRADVLRYER